MHNLINVRNEVHFSDFIYLKWTYLLKNSVTIDVIHRKVGDGEFGSLLQFSAPLFVFLISHTKQANSAKKIDFVLDIFIFYIKPKPFSELSTPLSPVF